MSDFAIKVEGLGKKFIIGHEKTEKYTALRDVISNNVKDLWKKTKELAIRNYRVEGNEEEEFWALKDLNFTINQGDRVGIIGRNGAGKSTLLKILSRITEPSEGRITIQGRVASLLEVGTGFHPELTGRENIFLNGAILGMSRADIKRKFDEIVEFAEVERFLDTPVKRYSSGMYVRLAFSVAAHLEPDILIVDEVLAVGDAQFQKKCLGKMEDVSKNLGRTVIFVSHQMGIISQLCKKSILLNNGLIVYDGLTNEVIETYLSIGKTDGSNKYTHSKSKSNYEYYFDEIYTVNQDYELTDQFAFSESILIIMRIRANQKYANVKVGFNILNSFGGYVSTGIETLDYENNKDDYKYIIRIPANIIAPNTYSFRFAIFSDGDKIYDIIDNECRIKVNDTGTKLSKYEGIDYGSVILDYSWQKMSY